MTSIRDFLTVERQARDMAQRLALSGQSTPEQVKAAWRAVGAAEFATDEAVEAAKARVAR